MNIFQFLNSVSLYLNSGVKSNCNFLCILILVLHFLLIITLTLLQANYHEIISGWIQSVPGNPYKAQCKICHSELSAHKAVLVKHKNSPEHLNNSKSVGLTANISKFTSSFASKQKETELKLAVYVAEHSAVRSIDHLGELLSKNHPESSTLANLKLHLAKCTALICNVLAPCFHDELVHDVKSSGMGFSLLLDEATDVSCSKTLGLVIRFFSTKLCTIVTTFYCLLPIQSGEATSQVESIICQLQQDQLPVSQLVGIGVDGANVNVGIHHSVSSLLKKQAPHHIQMHLPLSSSCSKQSHGCTSKVLGIFDSGDVFLV